MSREASIGSHCLISNLMVRLLTSLPLVIVNWNLWRYSTPASDCFVMDLNALVGGSCHKVQVKKCHLSSPMHRLHICMLSKSKKQVIYENRRRSKLGDHYAFQTESLFLVSFSPLITFWDCTNVQNLLGNLVFDVYNPRWSVSLAEKRLGASECE